MVMFVKMSFKCLIGFRAYLRFLYGSFRQFNKSCYIFCIEVSIVTEWGFVQGL